MPLLHAADLERGGWVLDPFVLLPLLLAAALYVRGFGRLQGARGNRGAGLRAASFAAGIVAILAALATPLEGEAERSLSMHMAQHLLLASIATPLLLAGRPLQVAAAGAPATAAGAFRAVSGALNGVARTPLLPFAAFFAVYFAWHVPRAYEAALEHGAIHLVEHLSFSLAAVVFWWPVVNGRKTGWRRPAGRILYLGAAMMVSGTLGVALMLSDGAWYAVYEAATPFFDLTPEEDQRVAGALMWAVDGAVYGAAAAALLARWVSLVGEEAETTMRGHR